jgi:hypothetical protein
MLSCGFVYVWNSDPRLKETTYILEEQSAEENIWAWERGSKRSVKKIA